MLRRRLLSEGENFTNHDYVEIGGHKWATMNIGATGVTDYGLYFSWGDIQGYTASQVGTGSGQKAFDVKDYKYGNGSSVFDADNITKYNRSDGLVTLDSYDDAARNIWGGSWRMPTSGDYQTLINSCNVSFIDNYEGSGIKGIKFTDKSDSSKVLFFPAAGYASGGSYFRNSGHYWSSTLAVGNVLYARQLFFNTYSSYNVDAYQRHQGGSIRGIVR